MHYFYDYQLIPHLVSLASKSQEVSPWVIEEVWAEKMPNGRLTFLADGHEDMPEAEEGGEVIEAYSNECEISESEEECVRCVAPSNFLCI